MSQLTVIDSISNGQHNVTWGLHTRAASIETHGHSATLTAPSGIRMRMRSASTPPGACGAWQSAVIKLTNGSLLSETRFPLRGAKKVWMVCAKAATELRVTLTDL